MAQVGTGAAPWVLVVEDEPRLQQQLVELLVQCAPDLGPIRTAATGEEALLLCRTSMPAVAFLDVRLPGISGIEVAHALSGQTRLVMVTAYDAFAVDAFEHGAVDYLLKPVSRERVERCVARLRGLASPAAAAAPEPAPSPPDARTHLKWIAATSGRKTHFIGVDDITYFKSDNKYTRVVCPDAEYLIEESLKQLLPRLDPAQFRQVHRSAVVNLREVLLVERDDAGGGVIRFRRHPDAVRVSAPFLREMKVFLD